MTDCIRVDGPTGEAAGERTTATHLLWGREDAARRLVVVFLETWLPTTARAASPTHRQSHPRSSAQTRGAFSPHHTPLHSALTGDPFPLVQGASSLGLQSLWFLPFLPSHLNHNTQSCPPSFPGVAKRNRIKYVNPSLPVRPILHV